MKKILALLGLAACLATPALAVDLTPLQLGLWGPRLQIFPEETRVMGLRLNLICSANQDVTGLDVGLIGRAQRMSAIQLNLANFVDDEFAGLSGGLFNQMGSVAGLQAGLFNTVAHDLAGFQVGLFNAADDVSGLQIGILNRAMSLHGVQIGLVNLNANGPVTFFPILNAAF